MFPHKGSTSRKRSTSVCGETDWLTSPIPTTRAAAANDQAAEMRHGESSGQRRASSNALLDVAEAFTGTDSCSAFASGASFGGGLSLISAAAAPNLSDVVKVFLYSFVLLARPTKPQITGADRSWKSYLKVMGLYANPPRQLYQKAFQRRISYDYLQTAGLHFDCQLFDSVRQDLAVRMHRNRLLDRDTGGTQPAE